MRGSVSIPFTSGLLSDGAPVAGRSRGYVSIPFTSGLLSDLAFAAACVVPAGLNPFYFRAAFGLARPRNRVGAARSQSLLLQGCFRTAAQFSAGPFSSGLNPFYFRAAFGPAGLAVFGEEEMVSIPFTSGLLSDPPALLFLGRKRWSQSLLLQGCFRTGSGCGTDFLQ